MNGCKKRQAAKPFLKKFVLSSGMNRKEKEEEDGEKTEEEKKEEK